MPNALRWPRLKRNVGLSLINPRAFEDPDQPVTLHSTDGAIFSGDVSALPFA